MSDPFIAEIIMFGGNFAPRSWAFCNGQLLPIAQNTALFSLLGTTYGGDGQTTFGLPGLQGRAPMHPGRGPGLTPRNLGEKGGEETVTLTTTQIPNHTHTLTASSATAGDSAPEGNVLANATRRDDVYGPATNLGNMAASSVGNTGGNEAHENMQPSLAVNFIIALQGTYPSRS